MKTSILQTGFASAPEDEEEAYKQDELHLNYIAKGEDVITSARDYLSGREGEAESIVNPNEERQGAIHPRTSPSEFARREQAQQERVTAAQQRLEEARTKAAEVYVEAAEEALRLLNIQQTDGDRFTSVSQRLGEPSGAAERWRRHQRHLNNKQETPERLD